MRRRYTQVFKGHIALSRCRFPGGLSGAQLDPLARHVLWRDGLDFDHGTRHGVGACLAVHEGPQSISKRATDIVLGPGMVFSVEPACYVLGEFGIRIESLVAVRPVGELEDGTPAGLLELETLTFLPYERALSDLSLLTRDETAWIDTYQAEVNDRLFVDLDEADRIFLEQSTAPLVASAATS